MQLKSLGLTLTVCLLNFDVYFTQLAQTSMISHRIIHNRALPHFKARINRDSERRNNEKPGHTGEQTPVDQNDSLNTKRRYESLEDNEVYRKQSDENQSKKEPYSKISRGSWQSNERDASTELDEADYDDIREGGGYIKFNSEEKEKYSQVKPSSENKYNNNYSGEKNYRHKYETYSEPQDSRKPPFPPSEFNLRRKPGNDDNRLTNYEPYRYAGEIEHNKNNMNIGDEGGYGKPSYNSEERYTSDERYTPPKHFGEPPSVSNYEVTEENTEKFVTPKPMGKIVGVPPPCARVTPPPPPKPMTRYYGPIQRVASVAASRRPLYRIRAPMYVVRRPLMVRPPPRVLHVHHYHPPPRPQSLQLHITRVPSDEERRRRYRRLVSYKSPRRPHIRASTTTLSPLQLAAMAYPI